MDEKAKNPSKKRCNEVDSRLPNRKLLRSSKHDFNWDNLCVICGQTKKSGNSVLQRVSLGSDIGNKILIAAKKKNDVEVIQRFEILGGLDLHSVDAGYHRKPCYINYTNQGKNPQKPLSVNKGSQQNNEPFLDVSTTVLSDGFENDNYDCGLDNSKSEDESLSFTQNDVAKLTLDRLTKIFRENEIITFQVIISTFNDIFLEKNEKISTISSSRLKKIIVELAEEYNISFHSEHGLPDLFCRKDISVTFLVRKIYNLSKVMNNDEKISLEKGEKDEFVPKQSADLSDTSILHRAVGILRKSISEIPSTKFYPTADEVSLDYSRKFVPIELQLFVYWIMDNNAFLKAADISKECNVNQTRMLALCECFIFSSANNIIPPFHFGLTLQLHYKFGSKLLIDTLNSYGFCATYDELRRFLTALAKVQIEKNKNVYVPPKIISRSVGGLLIQEGADNVDINTETIDGKGSYHAMARVIFQSHNQDDKIKMERVERQQQKSLEIDNVPFMNMLHYKKPTKNPEPPALPEVISKFEVTLAKCTNFFSTPDVAWVLLRSFCRGSLGINENAKQIYPNWVAFNTNLSKVKNTRTVVQYAPTINGKPSDVHTVYTTLKKGLELAKQTEQEFSIQTFDQQLYAVAQFIKFDLSLELKNSIPRLGSFHTACTLISCIGKIWSDSGLRDILADSGVYAGKTVDRMLDGKQFYRAVRALTLSYEVLMTLLLENFFEWLKQKEESRKDDNISSLSVVFDKIRNFQEKYANDRHIKSEFDSLMKSLDPIISSYFTDYIKTGSKESQTFEFWVQFLQAVQILLDFLRAERDYDWHLHITTHARMLPYFFGCNRPNYSRFGTYYVADMLINLPEKVKKEFENGNFPINFTPGAFKGIFSDMATEMTVIKNTKDTDSGIIGLTRKAPAILRWTLTQNVAGEYAAEMHKRSQVNEDSGNYENYVHEGEKPSLFKRDEEDFKKMLDYVRDRMTDPFSLKNYNPNLINISSGLICPAEISNSLLNVYKTGSKKMYEFLERLKKGSGFNNPINRNDLKTFRDIHKSTTYKVGGKETRKVIKPEIVYQRALMVANNRSNVDLKTILSVPLTDIPSALFQPDGARRTSSKSDLMHVLEKKIAGNVKNDKPPLQKINCLVIDGMAVLQSLSTDDITTFNDIGERVKEIIVQKFTFNDEIHLVFDRYDDLGINPKQQERLARYGTGGHAIEISGTRHVREFKKCLANNESKCNLTLFVSKYLQEHVPASKVMNNENKKLFIAGGLEPREKTFVISQKYQYEDFNMSCNHIDADTRIIFHVNNIQSRHIDCAQIIVESPDTDVLVLLISHYFYFESKPLIWFYTGFTGKKIDHHRYIPIHNIYEIIGPKKCLSLISLHAMTGCDTTSSFFFIGKTKAFTAFLKLSDPEIDNLKNIVDLPLDEALNAVTVLLNLLYTNNKLKKRKKSLIKDSYLTINELRYKVSQIEGITVDKVPPSMPALVQHVKRMIWQVNEWSQSRSENIISLDPVNYGWILENNILCINYFEGDTAMELLQKFICSCSGKNPCNTEHICSCLLQGFKCCELCTCSSTCKNFEVINDDILHEINICDDNDK